MSNSTFDLANSITSKVNTKWWEKAEPEQLSEWQELKDPSSSAFYYYNSITKEVTWEKPSELMSSDEIDQGLGWVWIDDEQEVFVPAKIISQNSKDTIVQDESGHRRTIQHPKKGGNDTTTLAPLKRSSLQRIVQDLVLLDSIDVPLILHNLRERFQKNEIYTNVGTILIAINPYCALPLYGDEIVRQYAHRRLGEEMKPHSFNIAHEAFIGLRDFSLCQSIIISGESGSGKTVSTKHCLNYLAFMAGAGNNVAERIIETNPILEAIGNAKTVRNDNSSRFGKYMQLFFRGKQCSISGCIIKTYLLEKIRVVSPGPNERNYHIFYQLLAGIEKDENLKKTLLLDKNPKDVQPTSYNYLKSCTIVDSIDDYKEYIDLIEAFDSLGFEKTLQIEIFQIIIAVLKIGNLNFSQDKDSYAYIDTKGSQGSSSDNDRYLNNAAELLKLDPKALSQVFVTKELRVKNQQTTIMKLNKVQSEQSRDAVSKFIYSYLFDWITAKLNSSIGQPNDQTKFIGCLDIFGFEIFEKNSFEQLCINYTNEILQQHFNYQTFKLEEEIYQKEKIIFKHIEFIDNQPMLDLISFKPQARIGSPSSGVMGILPQLDEELITVKGNDIGFLNKICDSHVSNPVFQKHSKFKTSFIIRHYAGFVTYDSTGFLEKNRDVLTEDCIDLLRTSSHPLLLKILPEQVSQQEKKASLGAQFRRQLDELMITLRMTNPSYIRCIKPNANKTPIEFNPRMCFEQLTYSGVFEATKIRKLGYPFRLQNLKFIERYQVLLENEIASGSNITEKCQNIINYMKLNKENIQIGVTMVLYRAEEHKMLELHRNIKVRLRETHEDLARLVKINPDSFQTEAEKETFFMDLAGTIRSADEFRIKTPISEQARRLLDKYVEERMDGETKQQLQQAVNQKDKTIIEKVLRVCEGRGYQTSLVRECAMLYEQICDCEMALGVSIQHMNLEFLKKSIEMYTPLSYIVSGSPPPLVTQAQALLDKINKAQNMLISSLKSLNHEHLKKSIEFCASFQYNSDPKLSSAKKKYNLIMSIRENLTLAKKNFNLSEMKEGLAQARDLGYECELVNECRLLLWRCQRIENEGEKAFNNLNDTDIRVILKAASEVHYPVKSNKHLKKLRLLVDGPLLDYYNAQLECSKKIGDHERAISLSLLLAEERITSQSNQWQISNFRLLKDPMTWGNEKFWGSAKYRADTMLSYNDAFVHSPITTQFINMPEPRKSDLTEKVLLCYENIQKLMFIRNSKRLPQRCEEILMIGCDYIEIRDEIYIGLIKNITNNQCENPNSVNRGFEVFTLCLLSFPPSLDMLYHLYHWLSLPQYKNYQQQWNLSFLLARISYLNAITIPFWGARSLLDNIPDVINHCTPKQMWFYDAQRSSSKDTVTTYDDLKIKYSDPNFEEKSRKAHEKSKKYEKKGLCDNIVPLSTKKEFENQIISRRNAHMQRQAGVVLLQQTPDFATAHAFISQQISKISPAGSQITNKKSSKNDDTDSDDDDDDSDGDDGKEMSRSAKISTKKKKVKKGGKDSLPSPPVSLQVGKLTQKKKKIVQQSTESEEDVESSSEEEVPKKKKKSSTTPVSASITGKKGKGVSDNRDVVFEKKNNNNGKKKVMVVESDDDEDDSNQKKNSKNSTTKKNISKKNSKNNQKDFESSDDEPVPTPISNGKKKIVRQQPESDDDDNDDNDDNYTPASSKKASAATKSTKSTKSQGNVATSTTPTAKKTVVPKTKLMFNDDSD